MVKFERKRNVKKRKTSIKRVFQTTLKGGENGNAAWEIVDHSKFL